MNSLFFEEEIEFSTVKGTNHGKIAWSSDGNFEVIATTALNWQSWLDENYASKKYLELCKELAKVGINDLQKWIIFSKIWIFHPTKDQLRQHKNSQTAYKWQCVQTRCFAIRLDIKFDRSFLSKMLWRGLADVSSWSKQTWSLIGRRNNERILIGSTSSSPNLANQMLVNPAKRPQFLADIWRCNDEIIKFIIRKFGGDLYWPDYHLRTAFFRILSENKLYILVELKDVVNFDGILYQSGYECFKSVLNMNE